MKQESKAILNDIGRTAQGIALKELLEEEIVKMKDISTISGTIEDMGKIVLARQEAEIILRRMLRFLLPEEEKKTSNQYR